MQKRFAFSAYCAVFAYRGINNLRGINAELGFKSTPRNQNNVIPEMQWRSPVLLIATDDNAR